MARIHETISVSSGAQLPSLGTLIGSRVSSEVFDSINRTGFTSFFGDEFNHMRQEFFERHVKPMDALNVELSRTVNLILNPDKFRILETMEDFQSIPPCMELAILMYEPVLQGVREGRLDGFGYDVNSLPDEDVFGRLIENFTCEDVAAASDAEGYYKVSGTLYSDDPDLSDDDLFAIQRTRDYIRRVILDKTDRDPTDIFVSRG